MIEYAQTWWHFLLVLVMWQEERKKTRLHLFDLFASHRITHVHQVAKIRRKGKRRKEKHLPHF